MMVLSSHFLFEPGKPLAGNYGNGNALGVRRNNKLPPGFCAQKPKTNYGRLEYVFLILTKKVIHI